MARGPAHGPPLLLLHGVLRRWSDFAPILPALGARWQVHGLDFRGHGGSAPAASGGYHVTDYVDDAFSILQSQIYEPAVVYGHSLGAMVALAVAVQQPDRVRAVILEDPPFGTMGSAIGETPLLAYFQSVQQAVADGGSVAELAERLGNVVVGSQRLSELRDAASIRFSAACLQHVDPAVFEPIVNAQWLLGYDMAEWAAQLDCPALVLQADPAAGGMLRDEDAEHLVKTAGCLRVRFPATGHLIHWARTEALLQATLNFLESLR